MAEKNYLNYRAQAQREGWAYVVSHLHAQQTKEDPEMINAISRNLISCKNYFSNSIYKTSLLRRATMLSPTNV